MQASSVLVSQQMENAIVLGPTASRKNTFTLFLLIESYLLVLQFVRSKYFNIYGLRPWNKKSED